MGIFHTFDCRIETDDRAVVAAIAAACGVPCEFVGRRMEWAMPGVRCVGRPDEGDAFSAGLMDKTFGFRPTHTFGFYLDKFDLYHAGIASMLRAVVGLFATVATDGVLCQNGERPLILRRAGVLTLQADEWWEDRLKWVAAELGGPHTFAAMPTV